MASKNSVESYKEAILKQLTDAGTKGLTKTALNIGNSKTKVQAFKELETNKAIIDYGTKRNTYYCLSTIDPIEIACEKVETKAKGQYLYTQNELAKACPDKIKAYANQAINSLITGQKLIKCFRNKQTFYFLHISAIQMLASPVPSVQPKNDPKPLDRDCVVAAYHKAKERLGFSNVEIYELQQELGVEMKTVTAFLKDQYQKGMATLSLGDWSLASEAIRSGAVYIDNKPYLLVRFK